MKLARCSVHTNYKGAASIERVKEDIVLATGCAKDVDSRDNLFFGYPSMTRHFERCYIIFDGYTPEDLHIEEFCDKVYVPSYAVYTRYNWKQPVKIVPHGVRYILKPKTSYEFPFLYISGLAPRKYPPGSDYVIAHLGKDILAMSSAYNPYSADKSVEYFIVNNPYHPFNLRAYTLDTYELFKLYSKARFYLALSGGGAFEMTPLEAMASGTVPITPNIPPFTEYNNCGLTFPVTGYYRTPGTDIFLYDPLEVIEIAKYAMSITDEQYYDMSVKCVEQAKKYYFLKVYPELFR